MFCATARRGRPSLLSIYGSLFLTGAMAARAEERQSATAFLAEADGTARRLDRWQWVALDHLADYLIPRLAHHIRSAAALDGTSAAYLEHGEQPAATTSP